MVWWLVHCCFGVEKKRICWLSKEGKCGLSVAYHPGKAKVMAESLSRKTAVELRVMFAKLSISKEGG